MTLTVTQRDWDVFAARYRRDRIPFLPEVTAHAVAHLDVEWRSLLMSDGVGGRICLYVGRRAREITCCVAGASEASDLAGSLAEAGIANVAVRVTAPVRPGGPTILPFVTSRFDAAIVAVRGSASPATELVQDVAEVLRPTGKLAVVIWSPARPTDPTDTEDPANILRRESSPVARDYDPFFRPVVRAIANLGFRNVRLEECIGRCLAPNGSAYLEMLRGRFAPRAQAAGLGSVPDSGARTASHLTQIAHPVPVESWAGIVFADAPDPIREMS